MRNKDILIDAYGLFVGGLNNWEDNFGYLPNYSDEELVEYIKIWAQDNNCDIVIVMYKFEEVYWNKVVPGQSYQVLKHMLDFYTTEQDFPHPSYTPQIIQSIKNELTQRGS